MVKLVRLNEETYENFVKSQPKSHFLQSYAWENYQK